MELPKTYNPESIEEKWYHHWIEKQYFRSLPDAREPYTVVIPPPNVTGVLHMGHMLNNTIQDVLVRRARMLGKNACWVPGTDHASIATEAKVVQKLKLEGINKSDLTREQFLDHAFAWKDKHGGIILQQLRKLGASCDWDRTHFTMDTLYSESVIRVFVDLFEKGKIYRGVRMVNWDPEALTAVSDEEVVYKEVNSRLFFIRYKVEGTVDEWLTVATTRPETILGDTAVCVNPDDIRYANYVGKRVQVPLSDRWIPIIADPYVDSTFGTGCLKVTPAHDINDYTLGKTHNLSSIDLFNDNGTLNTNGLHYEGLDRFEVRKLISAELQEKGYLVKTDDHVNKVGFSERTNAVIEPKLSIQWFLSMSELSKPALDNVMNNTIRFYPEKFKNTYRHWMENIKDWCISRQLWWGHQIPAWYYGTGPDDFIVAHNSSEALEKAGARLGRTLHIEELRQDQDVLDTWFSSWLWPISVFRGLSDPENSEISYYYPTNDLVTAPEIMFFWVARMIIAGYEYLGDLPFRNVYFTGIVRDKLGRKMSKSLGNSPDPIDLIRQFGADGVRIGVLISSPAGNDLPFDTSQCEQGRNFANKIWNALRLISGWEVREFEQPDHSKAAIDWFQARLSTTLITLNDLFDKFRISEALMESYKLVWDDFCSWYLEMIKPGYEQPIDAKTKEKTLSFFESLVKILHPFMPFVTEEIWHSLKNRADGEDLVVSHWPSVEPPNEAVLNQMQASFDVITAVRNFRKEQSVGNKVKLSLIYVGTKKNVIASVVLKMANLVSISSQDMPPSRANCFMIGGVEYFIPFGEMVDVDAEKEKISQELTYLRGFLASVQGKLNNERFVNSAPKAVIDNERKKESDTLQKMALLQERMTRLN
ncbi:MAG: valine--tRNA ligase [Bacteroidetes bacterium]|nr:valine--tRNA ligase [Bacteroidota bacterium]MBM3424205.1 valine--tRNA ligase [Bacteroidota bacterium]